jgi:hypothetical protein
VRAMTRTSETSWAGVPARTNSGRAAPGRGRDGNSAVCAQRAIGNQSMQRLAEAKAAAEVGARGGKFSRIPPAAGTGVSIRPKLRIATTGDRYEQEADRVADRVMRMAAPGPRPECAACGGPHEERAAPRIQPAREHGGGGATAPAIVHEVIGSPGRPLDAFARGFMESRFGHDFGGVRVHTGAQPAESARAVGARAYTVGASVVFGAGEYAPATPWGRRLLAHELAHVVQQRSAPAPARSGMLQRRVPAEISAEVGPVSVEGGMIHDTARKRMSVIVGPGDTLRTIARRLLPIWNSARSFTPPGADAPLPLTQLTEEQLARGLLVYNRYYLAVPSMTEWKAGVRFPLPIEVDPVTAERRLHPDLVVAWAGTFDPAWDPLLDVPPQSPAAPDQQAMEEAARIFLQENADRTARGIHLSAAAMRNAREAEPLVREVFRQAAGDAFDLALAFMDQLVIHQFDLLASQVPGQAIIDAIRNALASAPANPSAAQQASLARANRLLNRQGVFSTETAEQVGDIYVTRVPGSHCMGAVYRGFEGLFSEGVSRSIQNQVTRDSREVMRRTGRDTNHMDRIMETVRARGLAGTEARLVYRRPPADTWEPDPAATVLGMTQSDVAGWYFFGLSLHAAYHSVILAVDKSDPADPRIYWMDQFSRGFNVDVTGTLMRKMRSFRPSYGFSPSRLWQIIPPADTLIFLD